MISSHDVVELLKRDHIALQSYTFLISILNIPMHMVEQVQKSYNQNVASIHDLMKTIIDSWIQIEGNDATLGKLRNILMKNGFVALSGKR